MQKIQRRKSILRRKVLIFLTAMAVLLSNVLMISAEELQTEEIILEEEAPSEAVANVIAMLDAVPTVEQLQADFEAGRNHAVHTAAVREAKDNLAEAEAAYQQLTDEEKAMVTNAWILERFTLIPTPSSNSESIETPANETDAHVFMHSKKNPYYQHSPHDDRRMYLLVDTSVYGGIEWKPDGGPYDPSVPYNADTGAGNNFVAVYCCDADTGYKTGTYYERINLEDAGYYSEDAAAHIRAVVMNSYPFISGDEMRNRLDLMDGADDGIITNKVFKFQNESLGIGQTGFTGETVEIQVDDIEDAELLTAVQHVIWGYSNYTDDNDGLTLDAYTTHQYDRTVDVENTIYYPVLTKYYQYESDNKEAYDDPRKNNISAVAQYLCEKLEPEPLGESASEGQKSQIIISDVAIEEMVQVEEKETLYQVLVNVKLQNRRGASAVGGKDGDDITITVTGYDTEGNIVTDGIATVKADGKSEYQLMLNVAEGGKIDVEVSGTQYLPLGAYFYAAYDEDGEPENGESDLNPGQLEAQNFVGVAMGDTRIYASTSKTIKEVPKIPEEEKPEEETPKEETPKEETPKEEPKDESHKEPVEVYKVEEKHEPQAENQEVIVSPGTKTGDDSNIGYFVGVLLTAFCGVVGRCILIKKRKLR